MRRQLIPDLVCPACRCAVTLAENSSADVAGEVIDSGALRCVSCALEYPIGNGIPRMMPRSLIDAQRSEMAARDAQVAQYDANHFLNLFGVFEIPMTFRRLARRPTDLVLEGGCGTGRMTRKLAAGAGRVIAIDFSFDSLLSNARKLDDAAVGNVDLVQADICNLPFPDGLFDRVVSCQVLEHVPTADLRALAVAGLARVAKPGARLVLSAYRHSVFTRTKEGMHDGGIPFFRFTRDEFQGVLGTALKVRSITGKLLYLHLAACDKEN